MRSHYGGHDKDKVYTLILTNIIFSATICHPLFTIHHLPSGAWWLQLCKPLDQIPGSIHESILSGEIGSVLPLESELESIEPSMVGVYHVIQLATYL